MIEYERLKPRIRFVLAFPTEELLADIWRIGVWPCSIGCLLYIWRLAS